VFVVCRPPPSPSAVTASVGAEELQEQLVVWEEELMWREVALAAWEEKARISKKALVKVSANLDVEREKAEATHKEYIDKMEVHIAYAKHGLDLDKMLGEKKVQLDGREQDLDLREAVLVQVQSRDLNP
jgi:hypothetical protein